MAVLNQLLKQNLFQNLNQQLDPALPPPLDIINLVWDDTHNAIFDDDTNFIA